MSRTPRVIYVLESYVDITGDFVKAVILKTLVDETASLSDFMEYLKEEQKLASGKKINPVHGWLSKPAHELSEQTLLRLTPPPIRSHLNQLVNMGFLMKKPSENPFDKTTYYRVNLNAVISEMKRHGYRFSDYDHVVGLVNVGDESRNSRNQLQHQQHHREELDEDEEQIKLWTEI